MIVVDTSVWIDFFNGKNNPQTNILDTLLGEQNLLVGDLILLELLQGFKINSDYKIAKEILSGLFVETMLNPELTEQAAQHYRFLRKKGVTIRKTIDTIIATFCLFHNHILLHNDNDFLPFVKHLGLKSLD